MFEILVVDDEADICWALESALRDAGFRVTPVSGGVGAIREVAERRFDAAIVDVKLPGKSGLEVSQQIRGLDPRLKVVLISGYHYADDPPIQTVIRQRECQGFISKPFDLDQVSALLRRVIEEDRASPRPGPSPVSSGSKLGRR
ncbi:MAG: response regulator [Candidatus Tectomicrobia bacterium]|nr:response regulator [Candidatus Tectomicrobia bacterium]